MSNLLSIKNCDITGINEHAHACFRVLVPRLLFKSSGREWHFIRMPVVVLHSFVFFLSLMKENLSLNIKHCYDV